MIKAAGIHTKLFGGDRLAVADTKRRTANPTTVNANASHASWDNAQRLFQAATVVTTGAVRQTTIAKADGGVLPVRRGNIVKRKPTTKQLMKP